MNTTGLIFAAGVYSLIVKDNYRLAGLFTVFSYGVAAFLVLWLKEVNQDVQRVIEPHKEFGIILKQLVKSKYLLLLLVAVALLNETHQTITVFLSQLQYVKSGLSNTAIGYIYVAVTILGLLGGLSARLSKRLGVLPFSTLLYASCFFACITLAITHSAFLSVGAIILLRVCFSLFQPLQTDLQNKHITSANRATALSVNAVLIDGVAIATNILFGKLAEVNLVYAMILGAVFCLFGYLLFYLWHESQL